MTARASLPARRVRPASAASASGRSSVSIPRSPAAESEIESLRQFRTPPRPPAAVADEPCLGAALEQLVRCGR